MRTLAGLYVLGIVANPKTKTPCLATTDGEYIGMRSLRSTDLLRRLGRGYYESDRSVPYEVSDLPRVHTPDGVSVKGEGWGTSLYTSLCLGAELERARVVEINMYGRGAGISSWTDDRSGEADQWWSAARRRDLTDTIEDTHEEEEEDVELDPSPRELNQCLEVEGRITYVKRLSVDIERATERVVDIYSYKSAVEHALIAAEIGLEVPRELRPEASLAFVWKTILDKPSEIVETSEAALLALDVRELDIDGVNLLSLCYLAAGLGDKVVDDLWERWRRKLDPGSETGQGRLFTPNQAGLADVESARVETGWDELADLP